MSITQTLTQPTVRLTPLRWALFSASFSALAIVTPVIAHQFHLAGPIFLPMHLFVFVAALLFGWRVGLTVGVLSPLLSHVLTGMPIVGLLPLVTAELIVYGIVAGWLKEKMNLPVWLALLAAMVAGRIALIPIAAVVGPITPVAYVAQVIRVGWPGIVIQIALIPWIISLLRPYLQRNLE
ncbi:MAG: ECF transporter S component [Patescibacteria group bacterium]